jgi:hypothetical protein
VAVVMEPKALAKSRAPYGVDQDGQPIARGDTVIELIDGVPYIYTAGHEGEGRARALRSKAATKRRKRGRSR